MSLAKSTNKAEEKTWSRRVMEYLIHLNKEKSKGEDLLVSANWIQEKLQCPENGMKAISAFLSVRSREPIRGIDLLVELVGTTLRTGSNRGGPRPFLYKVNREFLSNHEEESLAATKRTTSSRGHGGRAGVDRIARDISGLPIFGSEEIHMTDPEPCHAEELPAARPKVMLPIKQGWPGPRGKERTLPQHDPMFVDYLLTSAIGVEEKGPTREWLIDIIKECAKRL